MSNLLFLAATGLIVFVIITALLEVWCNNSGKIDLEEEERLTKNK